MSAEQAEDFQSILITLLCFAMGSQRRQVLAMLTIDVSALTIVTYS
jgi:hypothetical protein